MLYLALKLNTKPMLTIEKKDPKDIKVYNFYGYVYISYKLMAVIGNEETRELVLDKDIKFINYE